MRKPHPLNLPEPLLLAALLLLGNAAPADDPPATSPDPRQELRKGNYDAAIEGFKRIAQTPAGGQGAPVDAVAARRGWAEALAATGKYEEALEALRSGGGPEKNPALAADAAAILARTGKLDEARSTLLAAGEAAEADGAPLAARVAWLVVGGQVDAAQGKLEEARGSFEKAIEVYRAISSDDAEALPAETFVDWALALIGLNRYLEANDTMFEQAQEKDAKHPQLLLEQGKAFLVKYNFADSREILKEAIEQNPRFADAHAALADNYVVDVFTSGSKRFEEAEKHIQKALEVNPRCAAAYMARGSIWLYDGNYARAIADLERSLSENRASLRAHGLLAACLFLVGDTKRFAAEEEAARSVNAKGAEFYHTLALALEHRFRYFDAVAMCDRALELDADYWPVFHTLGINCLRTGENGRGRKFLDKSWEKDKFNVWVINTRDLLRHMDRNYATIEESGFVFYFPKADAEILRTYLAPLLKESKSRLESRYRMQIPSPIQVECFSEHKWFSARTVGLEGFPASGACFGKLVTLTTPRALPQNWGAVAWHEFAHVAALALTEHRVPRWLTEGLSVWEEGLDRPHWARNFQRDLADAWASRRLLPLAELDFGFSKPKYPMQIMNSYFQGCMIVKLIVEKWSFDKVLDILRGYRENRATAEIFRDVLRLSLEEFDREFDASMARWVEANGYRPRFDKEMVPRLELQAEKNPKDARALADLAWAYLTTGNDIDAPITAAKALEVDPKDGDAHAVMGFSRLRDKKTRGAVEALEKALECNTRFAAQCHAQLGSIKSKEKDSRAKAIEHLEEAKRLSPVAVAGHPAQGNAYYLLAKLYEEKGDDERANQQMVELARFATEDAECRQRIVRHALERKKDPRLALKYLDELLFIDPFEPKFHKLLARAAAEVEDHDIAIRENTILLGFPDSNPRQVRMALARSHLAKGDKAKAGAEARRVLEIDPEHEEAKAVLRKVGEN